MIKKLRNRFLDEFAAQFHDEDNSKADEFPLLLQEGPWARPLCDEGCYSYEPETFAYAESPQANHSEQKQKSKTIVSA